MIIFFLYSYFFTSHWKHKNLIFFISFYHFFLLNLNDCIFVCVWNCCLLEIISFKIKSIYRLVHDIEKEIRNNQKALVLVMMDVKSRKLRNFMSSHKFFMLIISLLLYNIFYFLLFAKNHKAFILFIRTTEKNIFRKQKIHADDHNKLSCWRQLLLSH